MNTSQLLTETISESYETLPYNSRAFRETHPNHLATLGILFGMSPPPVENCRVLELGCASGGNLIPMATSLPGSEFVGIDLSPGQIQQGEEQSQRLSLTNLNLVAGSLSEINTTWGKFDYIIAHGIYSWVPEAVRKSILAICRDFLTAHGIAYVSYNTYPGWHLRGIVRELLQYQIPDEKEAKEKVAFAKTLCHQLSATHSQRSSEAQKAYNTLLSKELKRLANKDDSYLFHEYLESVNVPFYFHEFIAEADGYQLQYLGEAIFSTLFDYDLSSDSQNTLQYLANDLISQEQYLDILRNRMFRQTLLCHDTVALDRCLSADRVQELGVYSSAQPKIAKINLSSIQEEEFTNTEGAIIRTKNPATKMALCYLGRIYPRAISVLELASIVENRLNSAISKKQLAGDLLRCFSVDLVTLTRQFPICQKQVNAFPVAFSVSREQAKEKQEVVNAHHKMVQLTETSRQLLPYLDGKHNQTMLAELLSLSQTKVDKSLRHLAKAGVLIE